MLVEFRGVSSLAEHLGLPEDETARRWLTSPAVRSFERGCSDEETFSRAVCAEFLPAWEPAALRAELEGWIPGLLPGALELLGELREADVPASCLSNTNRLHWRRMRSWGLEKALDHAFLSFRLGMVKPDREIFEAVTGSLGLRAPEILFLDDHPANVEAARSHGLLAQRVHGPQQARRVIRRAGLLDGAPDDSVAQRLDQ